MSEPKAPGEVTGGGPRPGKARCECQSYRHDPTGGCPRVGTMLDGLFLCGPCKRFHR